MSKDSASKRTPNFTHLEEKLLLELTDKHKRVVENKKNWSGSVERQRKSMEAIRGIL
jgi:hypothetical protein